jgi:hypothetical protein
MPIDLRQRKQLQQALLSAFPDPSELAQMVSFGLGRNLKEIALGDNLQAIVFGLITWAEAHAQVAPLIAAALEANPDNPDLRQLAAGISTSAAALAPVDLPPPTGCGSLRP